MFRLQENTPEVYLKYSRDFQLFCRIFDSVNNSVRFNIKSTQNLLNPFKVNDSMLPLLATRVGFFPKGSYDSRALRWVIASFPYIMHYKGSKQGIALAFNTLLKAEGNYDKNTIIIDSDTSTVSLYSETPIQNELLLRDVLSYILPIGYRLQIRFAQYLDTASTQLGLGNTIRTFTNYSSNSSIIINNLDDEYSQNETVSNSISRYNISEVLGVDDLFISDNEGNPDTITEISNE